MAFILSVIKNDNASVWILLCYGAELQEMMINSEFTTRRLIVGCGYLGLRVGRIWARRGEKIFALTRKPQRFAEFRRQGWSPLLGDLCGPLPEWPEVDTALLAVGFDRKAEHPIERVYVKGIERLIDSLPDSISRLVYISSTGVYGSATREWVDEETACHPERQGGAACLEAERRLQASRFADRLFVLRLAGIYGPNRVPRIQSLADGAPIAANPDGFLNLIQVDDAARIVDAVATQAEAPNVYCVTDGSPCRRRDFLGLAAELMQLPPPTFVAEREPSDLGGRRGGDKRVSSRKLFADLAIALDFPSYETGLADAIARSEWD